MNNRRNRFVRIAVVAALVSLALLGTGCLGVFQEITAGPAGRMQTRVRFTMSKAMIESLNEMGGEPMDTDEVFDPADGPVDPNAIPGLVDVVVEKVDNPVDVGMAFRGTLSRLPSGTRPEDAPFIPFDEGNGFVIALPPLGEDDEPSDPQSEQFAAMFFASTKYQLVLDKALYPTISSAEVEVAGGRSPALVSELPGSWLVEFPISTWFNAAEGCRLVVER